MAHIVLQLREQGDGCRRGHALEHILLPVLAFEFTLLGNLGAEVVLDDAALPLVGDHLCDALAVTVDGLEQFAAATTVGGQHDAAGSLQVLLIAYVVDVAVLAVALADDGHLQFLGQVIQRVAHLADILGPVVPLLHLGGVGLHLLVEVLIDTLVGLHGILRSLFDAVGHDGETLQHIAADVEGQHGHQHDVHQIDHLLTRRYSFLFYLSHSS